MSKISQILFVSFCVFMLQVQSQKFVQVGDFYCISEEDKAYKEDCKDYFDKCNKCYEKPYIDECVTLCKATNGTDVDTCTGETVDKCQEKYEDCKECQNKHQKCLTCAEGAVLKIHSNHTKTCEIDDCPAGQFHPNASCTECKPCTKNCNGTCSGPEPYQCAGGCVLPYYWNLNLKLCVKDNSDIPTGGCPSDRPYLDQSHDNAASYKGGAANVTFDKCVWDQGGAFECVSECPAGKYLDTSDNRCKCCYQSTDACGSCQTCSGPLATECNFPCPKKCAWSHVSANGGACSGGCPKSKFPAGIADTQISACDIAAGTEDCICEHCHPSCETCVGNHADHCLTCADDKVMKQDGTCVEECAKGEFQSVCPVKNIPRCYQCHVSCGRCTSGGPADCDFSLGDGCAKDYEEVSIGGKKLCYDKWDVDAYLKTTYESQTAFKDHTFANATEGSAPSFFQIQQTKRRFGSH